MLVPKNADASFDFHMAVRAKQHAFRGLLAQCRHRPGEAPAPEPEALGARITVMKLQRPDAPVIAAQAAPAAELFDERPLGLLAIAGDAVRAALRAPILAAGAPDMDRWTMRRTDHLATSELLFRTPGDGGRLKAVLLEPVSDRVVAPIQLERDVAHTQVLAHELRQPPLLNGAAGRVPRRADGLKAGLSQPVRDRRRMAIDSPADFLERAALGQHRFECLPIQHDTNTSSHIGRNR